MPDTKCDFCKAGRCTRGIYGEFPALETCAGCGLNTATIALKVTRQAIPPDRWPPWAKAIGLLRKAGDEGVGDTLRNLAKPVKISLSSIHVLPKVCGKCDAARATLNQRYAYSGVS